MNRRNEPVRGVGATRLSALVIAGALTFAVSHFSSDGFRLGAQSTDPCAPPNGNPIVCENQKAGAPASEWDVSGAGDPSIQGFSTDISVNRGQAIGFKIKTDAPSYTIDIYRMGYYGGFGARKVASISPSVALPQTQSACLSDATTGLIDCGNWAVSASWAVPSTAVSGIYFARLNRPDTGGASHIVFVVRDDSGRSDLLFQTSDTTWQAYNQYGGNSLYVGSPVGRAYKVSYNRPVTVRGTSPEDSVFNSEYPMVRWLEANGFNVSYFSGIDSDRLGSEILEHKAFLSVGHDEYWSGAQRANVEAARGSGVHLAFFSGNEVFWKTRWENSLATPGTSYRTLVCYKETHANAKIDPAANVWTGTWEDPRFSPPADGGRPSNSLTGTLFRVNSGTGALRVPAAEGKLRFWRNTSVAALPTGGSATLGPNIIGYEWDEDVPNAFRPAGLIRLSDTTLTGVDRLQDYGSTYASGTANHSLTLYRHPSGAWVFGAGTVQWSWGLDDQHERGADAPSLPMQQATVNLFADMGVQPRTPSGGVVTTTASADTSSPASVIVSPASGSTVPANSVITVSGTAGDSGGGRVAGVEVSTDGGGTWQRAAGREAWTFSLSTGPGGSLAVSSRAVDDSGNLEQPSGGISLLVDPGCPCSLWGSTTVPGSVTEPDGSALEVGVKFRVAIDGYITRIRFYKGPQNIGSHTGHLWTASGSLLSTVSFSGESASGWQVASLPQAVPVTANTTYVVSYYAPNGFYSADSGYFNTDYVRGPLLAPASGTVAGNGVYRYGASGFPSDTFNASNYWVDVVFTASVGPDTTPPTVVATVPVTNASGVNAASPVQVQFSEPINGTTVNSSTFELRRQDGSLVPGSVSYTGSSVQATFQPSDPLTYSSPYSATIKGGSSGVKDVAGNALSSNYTWAFATGPKPPPALEDGPGGPILIVSSANNPFTKYYAEILRAEGLNAFLSSDLSTVTPSVLAAHDIVILGEMPLSAPQVSMFTDWVTAGGQLIAMRPDKKLAG
ncbi:MAG: N,N-dimethylformamidase beta subunit family domain-containing protein, partial [Gammaproteobacteria bacterium]